MPGIGRKVRVLRIRLGWRQEDLGERARVSRGTVSRIESGTLDPVTFRALREVSNALGARLLVDIQWRSAELDRLLDAHHAALQEWLAASLRRHRWDVRVEVSFNHFGDRGRYDVLAFHTAARTLLVVEIKTSVGDIQELLGRLDVKVRVALRVARDLGWRPRGVVPLLLLTDSSTARRHVRNHATLFDRFATRGPAAAAWLKRPVEAPAGVPTGLLIFRKAPYAHQGGVIRVLRARKPHSHTTTAPGSNPASRGN